MVKKEFDKSMDKVIVEREIKTEKGKIIVSVMQYGQGEKKIQLSRLTAYNGEMIFAKLGRLDKEEAKEVAVIMAELVGSL